MENYNLEHEKIKTIDFSFFFFFLGTFIGFIYSLFFLLACSFLGDNQIIFIKSFKMIDIFCNVFTFVSLSISCLFDYNKFVKKFLIFKKIGLTIYFFGIIAHIMIFLFNNFFIKILFQLKTKEYFFTNVENKYNNFFNFALTNFVFIFFLSIFANVLQLKVRKNIFCFDDGKQKKRSLSKNNDKSDTLSH